MTGNNGTVAYIQGVQTNDTVVDPVTFATFTRRQKFPMQAPRAIAGLGTSDNVQLKKTGVVSALEVRIAGDIAATYVAAGNTPTYEWPYNLVKAFKVSVNGQSTLIDARGLDIKLSDIAGDSDLSDRGVVQNIGAAGVADYQGSLSQAHEDWGTGATETLAPGVEVTTDETFAVDLTYVLPLAANQVSLIGSIFGQSQATNINLEVVYSTEAELFTLGAGSTIDLSALTMDVTGVAYAIPVVSGKAVVPDLSQLHGLNTWMQPVSAAGEAEYNLPGTGQGRKLLRLWWNLYDDGCPLQMSDANYLSVGYRYGSNTVPETYPNGSKLRAANERQMNSDIGRFWGYGLWDYASQWALRDLIDLGQTSDFRLFFAPIAAPTHGRAFITQETLFAAAVGA
jgi:hypothetical protein